jgi:hypothetical protein
MAELDGLIDSKISLISQEDVKFDGTLFSINAEESSMVLKDGKLSRFASRAGLLNFY